MRSSSTLPLLGLSLFAFAVVTSMSLQAQPDAGRIPTVTDECISNSRSNVELYYTNNGTIGFMRFASNPGGYWPRGSNRHYVYGGGLWFGARKRVSGTLRSLSVIGYDPNSGFSWFTPGIVSDTTTSFNRFRLYRSIDYDGITGAPLDAEDLRKAGAYWPIWHTQTSHVLGFDGYTGSFLYDTSARRSERWGPPLILSDEDIVSTYSDRDLSRFDERDDGLPLGIQVEESSYSWDQGELRDVVAVRYRIINRSTDTLFDCYIAWALDLDIGRENNDRSFVAIRERREDSLDLVVAHSDVEPGWRYGYAGIDLFETPERDPDGFVRGRDGLVANGSSIGLTTFRSWSLVGDPKTPEQRYSFMASGRRDTNDFASDKRQLVSTGPFHMRPGDTAIATMGLLFAMSPGTTWPTGTWSDLQPLLALDLLAQAWFDRAFRFGDGFASIESTHMTSSPKALRIVPSVVGPDASNGEAFAIVEVAHASRARLRLIDARGEVVATSHLGVLPAGSHHIPIRYDDLAPGMYAVVVDVGAFPLRGRMLVRR